MSEETDNNSNEALLLGLAQRVRTWQEAQQPRLTDAALIHRFPSVGTSKTYKNIREGRFDGYNVDAQLENYAKVIRQLEELDLTKPTEELYEDLANAAQASRALLGLMNSERGLLLLEGPSGSGKTTVKKIALAKFPLKIISVDAKATWTSKVTALRDIAVALGASEKTLKRDAGELMGEVIKRLDRAEKVLWIDEGHHMTGTTLNLVKSIINDTSTKVVISCIKTLWTKLASANTEEAKQLVVNRLYRRVSFDPPMADEVQTFLARRCVQLPAVTLAVAEKIAEKAQENGRYAFIRNLADRVHEEGGDSDGISLIQLATRLEKEVQVN